jgi:hypothetical protein
MILKFEFFNFKSMAEITPEIFRVICGIIKGDVKCLNTVDTTGCNILHYTDAPERYFHHVDIIANLNGETPIDIYIHKRDIQKLVVYLNFIQETQGIKVAQIEAKRIMKRLPRNLHAKIYRFKREPLNYEMKENISEKIHNMYFYLRCEHGFDMKNFQQNITKYEYFGTYYIVKILRVLHERGELSDITFLENCTRETKAAIKLTLPHLEISTIIYERDIVANRKYCIAQIVKILWACRGLPKLVKFHVINYCYQ